MCGGPETAARNHSHLAIQFLCSFAKFQKKKEKKRRLLACLCCHSVCPYSWNNSAATERILMKFDISIFENLSRKFMFL